MSVMVMQTLALSDASEQRSLMRLREKFLKIGARAPLVGTGDGVREPRNRRVEINF